MLTASYLCIPYDNERTISKLEWEESIPLDAPNVIVIGSHERYEFQTTDGFTPLPCCIERGKSNG